MDNDKIKNNRIEFPKVHYDMADRFNITMVEIELPRFGDN
jgi:hypothetical protein